MKPNIEELRKKYMDNPPEGMTSKDISCLPLCRLFFI